MQFTYDPQHFLQISFTEFHSIPTIGVKNKYSLSFGLRPKVWLSTCWFSWKTQLINCVMWRPSILNFTKIGPRNLELTGRKLFLVREQMLSHRTDLYATIAWVICSTVIMNCMKTGQKAMALVLGHRRTDGWELLTALKRSPKCVYSFEMLWWLNNPAMAG